MSTNVYIDGFNLYYGALKGTAYKWLDIRRLAEGLFPHDDVNDVYYFTARLRTLGGNGRRRQRQDFYLRAVSAIPSVQAVYGTYQRRGNSWEEKKTDVNIATAMIFDAFYGNFTHAVVVSNDSDLVTPIQRIRDEPGLRVTVVNPVLVQSTHRELRGAATDVLEIETKHLRANQLPPKIQDASGRWISKPPSW